MDDDPLSNLWLQPIFRSQSRPARRRAPPVSHLREIDSFLRTEETRQRGAREEAFLQLSFLRQHIPQSGREANPRSSDARTRM